MKTKIVNRKRTKNYDVYVGRPSKYGNPYVVGRDGTREEVIALYEGWLMNRIAAEPGLLEEIRALRGKVLACWCAPLPCHGDVLARIADGEQDA